MNKDVVRRILAARYRPQPDSAGPSWLTVLGHAKDTLWSLDLFRCESAVLRTHWVLVVINHCTRRIVGFGVHRGVVDGVALCQMFNQRWVANLRRPTSTRIMIPLYRFHQWQANLRVLDVEAIRTVPYVPVSHPGSLRRLCGNSPPTRSQYCDGVQVHPRRLRGPRYLPVGFVTSQS
jgi:hypothetical protein